MGQDIPSVVHLASETMPFQVAKAAHVSPSNMLQDILLFEKEDLYCACFLLAIIVDLHYTTGDLHLKLKIILTHYSLSQIVFAGFIQWVIKMKKDGLFQDISSDGSPGRLIRYSHSLIESNSQQIMVYTSRFKPLPDDALWQ